MLGQTLKTQLHQKVRNRETLILLRMPPESAKVVSTA